MMVDLIQIHDELVGQQERASNGTWNHIHARLKAIYPNLEITFAQIRNRYQSYMHREANRRLVESMNATNSTRPESINIDTQKETLTKIAREILDNINEIVGDLKPRQKHSTISKEITPNKEETIFLNNLFSSMVFMSNLDDNLPNEIKLWNINCCKCCMD